MKFVRITTTVGAKQEFLPTKRHKKTRERHIKEALEILVKKANIEEAPIAFLAKNKLQKEAEVYRYFENELYIKRKVFHEKYQETNADALPDILSLNAEGYFDPEFREGESIITWSDIEERKESARQHAEKYLIIDDIVWIKSGEPVYKVEPHMYGWKSHLSFKIGESREKMLEQNEFTAAQRKEAIEYAQGIVENYNIDSIEADEDVQQQFIEVLIPEAIQCYKPMIKNCGNCVKKNCTKGLKYSCEDHVMVSENYPQVYVVGYDLKQIMKKALRANVMPVNIEMLQNAYDQPNLNSTKTRIETRNQMLNNCSAIWVFEGDLISEDRYEKFGDTTAENEFKEAAMERGIPIYYLETESVFPDDPAVSERLQIYYQVIINGRIVETTEIRPEIKKFVKQYILRLTKTGLLKGIE
jgi:hypothetical protein